MLRPDAVRIHDLQGWKDASTYVVYNKSDAKESCLTSQIACEYAQSHPGRKILVVDLCPQTSASMALLGRTSNGDPNGDPIAGKSTISGYIGDRIRSPYTNTNTGAAYVAQVSKLNKEVPDNVYLVSGDRQLKAQSLRVANATTQGPASAWRIVHTWISDLIGDVKRIWNHESVTTLIDCDPKFSIYTELALSASDQMIISLPADSLSAKQVMHDVLGFLCGTAHQGSQQSRFYQNSQRFRLQIPKIFCYTIQPACDTAVAREINNELWSIFQANPNLFHVRFLDSRNLSGKTVFDETFRLRPRGIS